jgi:hypothetical protein
MKRTRGYRDVWKAPRLRPTTRLRFSEDRNLRPCGGLVVKPPVPLMPEMTRTVSRGSFLYRRRQPSAYDAAEDKVTTTLQP